MAKTRAQVVNRALYNLGVKVRGQAASAEDYEAVDELVDGVVEGLIQREIYFLQDVDVTPEEVFIPLGHILAWAAASIFDQHNDPALLAFSKDAERDLEKMGSLQPSYQTLEIEAY